METYSKKDGIKAIILFVIAMIIPCVFDGLPAWTTLSYGAICAIKLIGIIVGIVVCLLFVITSKQPIKSIGIHKGNLGKTIVWGICGGVILIALKGIFSYCMGWRNINLMVMRLYPLLSFSFGAIQEEIVFRGYIQTRLKGLIKNDALILMIVAIMFLLVHYPVMWMVGGYLPLDRVIWLVILSFVCGVVYKKTDNVWSAIIVHLLYNLVTFY